MTATAPPDLTPQVEYPSVALFIDGLAADGFTDSAATAERLIAGFEAGILSINHCSGSVPQAPSGGVKDSGYGREGGHEGRSGYLVTKRVPHRLRP